MRCPVRQQQTLPRKTCHQNKQEREVTLPRLLIPTDLGRWFTSKVTTRTPRVSSCRLHLFTDSPMRACATAVSTANPRAGLIKRRLTISRTIPRKRLARVLHNDIFGATKLTKGSEVCETDSILGFCGLVRLQVIYGQLAPSLHVSLSIFTERNLFFGPRFLLCLTAAQPARAQTPWEEGLRQ